MRRALTDSLRDLLPIILVIGFFQTVVLRQPFLHPGQVFTGLIAVVFGLALFVQGLNLSLFPIGEGMAEAFAKRGSLFWLMMFAFSLGFGTTIAEPALIAVAGKAAEVKALSGLLDNTDQARDAYATGLRYTVALSVGLSLVVGVLRIIKGWPLHWIIIAGYVVIVALTEFAPQEIIGVAYDSGGVTTSTITVPLVTALGIGLSTVIKGRSPMIDGFGLIAFASLFPIAFVIIYGMVV
ncbi:MAG: DUF1538 domain-containing protein [Nitrospinaceae bacterium]|jgi:hypothetical protein|nr:MAG: DUF1538 domain-containing protein [Nitrospinaceae bacterium]